jgi:hypothetical protein
VNDDKSKKSMKNSKNKISEIEGFNNFIFQMQQKDKIHL